MKTQLATLAVSAAVMVGALAAAAPTAAAGPISPISFSARTLTLKPAFSHPQQVAVADVDHVNGPDIVVLGYLGDVGVFLNRGTGGFFAPKYVTSPCGFTAESLAVGQFSSDTNA